MVMVGIRAPHNSSHGVIGNSGLGIIKKIEKRGAWVDGTQGNDPP